MSSRTEKAVARAGALDRAETYINEAKRALDAAKAELQTVEMHTEEECNCYNDVSEAANRIARAAVIIIKL